MIASSSARCPSDHPDGVRLGDSRSAQHGLARLRIEIFPGVGEQASRKVDRHGGVDDIQASWMFPQAGPRRYTTLLTPLPD
jgi:hypothetical protein